MNSDMIALVCSITFVKLVQESAKKASETSRIQKPSHKSLCSECGITFSRVDVMKTHVSLVHVSEDVPRVSCKVSGCKWTFFKNDMRMQRYHAKWHKNKHLQKIFKCETCGYKTPKKSNYTRHMKRH